MYKHLIFDLDGTLIDSSDGVVEAVNYSLRQVGAEEQPPEVIKPYIGYPLEQMYPDFTDAPYDELYAHFGVKAAESVVRSSVALPHVEKLLERLAGTDLKLAVATTKIRMHVDGIINKLGWGEYFDVIVGGDEAERFKPDPAIFQITLDRLGADPTRTMVVGDTINDVLAAKAVPMAVTAVASPYGNSEELIASEPDHFVQSIDRLPSLLGID